MTTFQCWSARKPPPAMPRYVREDQRVLFLPIGLYHCCAGFRQGSLQIQGLVKSLVFREGPSPLGTWSFSEDPILEGLGPSLTKSLDLVGLGPSLWTNQDLAPLRGSMRTRSLYEDQVLLVLVCEWVGTNDAKVCLRSLHPHSSASAVHLPTLEI